jgi:hypothetical protein
VGFDRKRERNKQADHTAASSAKSKELETAKSEYNGCDRRAGQSYSLCPARQVVLRRWIHGFLLCFCRPSKNSNGRD